MTNLPVLDKKDGYLSLTQLAEQLSFRLGYKPITLEQKLGILIQMGLVTPAGLDKHGHRLFAYKNVEELAKFLPHNSLDKKKTVETPVVAETKPFTGSSDRVISMVALSEELNVPHGSIYGYVKRGHLPGPTIQSPLGWPAHMHDELAEKITKLRESGTRTSTTVNTSVPGYITTLELSELTGASRSAINKYVSDNKLPKPVLLSSNKFGWPVAQRDELVQRLAVIRHTNAPSVAGAKKRVHRKRRNMLTPEQITELRLAMSMDPSQFASVMNVTEVTLHRWESGQRRPGSHWANRMKELRNVHREKIAALSMPAMPVVVETVTVPAPPTTTEVESGMEEVEKLVAALKQLQSIDVESLAEALQPRKKKGMFSRVFGGS